MTTNKQFLESIQNYVLINPMGTDDGKPFNSLSEALSYLYNTVYHQKVHMNAYLVDMTVTENKFIIKIDTYDYFKGRSIQELGIKVMSKDDAIKIKNYFEINF